jgi:hypothetical protein
VLESEVEHRLLTLVAAVSERSLQGKVKTALVA